MKKNNNGSLKLVLIICFATFVVILGTIGYFVIFNKIQITRHKILMKVQLVKLDLEFPRKNLKKLRINTDKVLI